MDTFLRLTYEITRAILVVVSAILQFTSLMLCTLLFCVRKLREALDDYFNQQEEQHHVNPVKRHA